MIPKKKLKNVTPLGNLFAHDEGIDDEYYINEIIGIDELPYDEFVKKPEPKIAVPAHRTEAMQRFFEAWGVRK